MSFDDIFDVTLKTQRGEEYTPLLKPEAIKPPPTAPAEEVNIPTGGKSLFQVVEDVAEFKKAVRTKQTNGQKPSTRLERVGDQLRVEEYDGIETMPPRLQCGATIMAGSQRFPATVVQVRGPSRIFIQMDKVVSDPAYPDGYTFLQDLAGNQFEVRRRLDGYWYIVSTQNRVIFGIRRYWLSVF